MEVSVVNNPIVERKWNPDVEDFDVTDPTVENPYVEKGSIDCCVVNPSIMTSLRFCEWTCSGGFWWTGYCAG